MNEYYRARNSRRIQITFQILNIAPVVWEPHIHFVLFDPWDHWNFGGNFGGNNLNLLGGNVNILGNLNNLNFPGGWHHPALPALPALPGLPGLPALPAPPFVFTRHGGDNSEEEDFRLARHREHMARLGGEIAEIASRPQGYLGELMRGWQAGGTALEDSPERRRLGQLWRDVEDLRQQCAAAESDSLNRWRQRGRDRNVSMALDGMGLDWLRADLARPRRYRGSYYDRYR